LAVPLALNIAQIVLKMALVSAAIAFITFMIIFVFYALMSASLVQVLLTAQVAQCSTILIIISAFPVQRISLQSKITLNPSAAKKAVTLA